MAASLLAAYPAAAQPSCVVVGRNLTVRVHVTPPGEPPFSLDVARSTVRMMLQPGALRAQAPVRVSGALVFDGLVDPTTVPVRLARSGSYERDRLRLTPWTLLSVVRTHGDAVYVQPNLVVARVDVCATRMHSAEPELQSALRIPCSELTIDEPPAGHRPPPPGRSRLEGRVSRRPKLALHPGPGSGDPLELDVPEGVTFALLASRGSWTEVGRWTESGAVLRGWVRASAVAIGPRVVRLRTARYQHCNRPRRPPQILTGLTPRRLRAGTGIYASPRSQRPWARVADDRALFRVRLRPHARRVQLVHVPGLIQDGRLELTNAWIDRSVSGAAPMSPLTSPGSSVGLGSTRAGEDGVDCASYSPSLTCVPAIPRP